jgi:hypothetical protein
MATTTINNLTLTYKNITPIINSNTIYMHVSYASVQYAEIYMFQCQL